MERSSSPAFSPCASVPLVPSPPADATRVFGGAQPPIIGSCAAPKLAGTQPHNRRGRNPALPAAVNAALTAMDQGRAGLRPRQKLCMEIPALEACECRQLAIGHIVGVQGLGCRAQLLLSIYR